jgi:hypothetical protein
VRGEHHRALTQSQERLQVSIASELEAEAKARFEQQLTTFAASSARFKKQQASNRANDEHIRHCLRSRHSIHTLIYSVLHHRRLTGKVGDT